MNKDLKDEEVLREAMVNAYGLIVGSLTYEEFLDNGIDGMWLPSGFEDDVTSIDSVLAYFIETEEYEKCADLVKIQKELKESGEKDELTKIFDDTEWREE